MPRFINERRFSFFPVVGALVLALLVWGCGTDSSPVAPDEPTLTQTADGRIFLAFSESAALRAAKLAEEPYSTNAGIAQVFGVEGGELEIEKTNGEGITDDLKVIFRTAEGALTEDVLITMAVYGETMSDLVVAFGPSGLVFLVEAELDIRLGRERVDMNLEELIVWHIHDDGLVEMATHRAKDWGDIVRIQVDVPGFSRFSMGGGEP